MKITTITGVRSLIKAAGIGRAITSYNWAHESEFINRNQVSFRQMKILKPVWMLNGGGGTHTEITTQRLVGIKKVLTQNRPDRRYVHSDTNIALTDVLCASKLHSPVLHSKAGWHSFSLFSH